MVWLPSLLLSIMTFPFAGLAVYVYIDRGFALSSLSRDSPLHGTFKFIRPILNSILISSLMFSSIVLTIYARVKSAGGVQPVLSWQATHSQMSVVNVIPPSAKLDITRVAFSWWVIPASSFVYITTTLLCFVYGSRREYLRRYVALGEWFRESFHLPITYPPGLYVKPQHIILKSTTSPTSVHFSVPKWHDTSRPTPSPAKAKVRLPPLTIPMEMIPVSPAPDSDDSFTQSTLAYVGSPTGRQALGLPPFASSTQEPAKASILPPPPALTSSVFVTSPQSSPGDTLEVADPVDRAPDSRPNSILSAPWPLPPSTVSAPDKLDPSITVSPPSPLPLPTSQNPSQSLTQARPQSVSSISTSLASSTISMSPYGSAITSTPMPHDVPRSPHDMPFQDFPAAPSTSGLAVPRRVRSMRSKQALTRNLSLASLRSRDHRDRDPIGSIVMTVVKETA